MKKILKRILKNYLKHRYNKQKNLKVIKQEMVKQKPSLKKRLGFLLNKKINVVNDDTHTNNILQ